MTLIEMMGRREKWFFERKKLKSRTDAIWFLDKSVLSDLDLDRNDS